MKNKKMFKKWMSVFKELFDVELSKSHENTYWEKLQLFSDEECEEGFKAMFRTAKEFPTPTLLVTCIQFLKIYKAVSKKGGLYPEHLPGIIEEDNIKTRHLDKEVPAVVIGGLDIKRKILDS